MTYSLTKFIHLCELKRKCEGTKTEGIGKKEMSSMKKEKFSQIPTMKTICLR